MNNYSISFKISDYNPKISSISYNNCICLLIYGDFQLRIPIIDNEYQFSKHILKNIKSDIYYRITLFDDRIKILMGISDFIIPYKILYKIKPNTSYIYEKKIKFSLCEKTKKKLFGMMSNKIENIYIDILAKIINKQKLVKNETKIDFIKNYITQRITASVSFIKKTNGNLLITNKNRIIKDKDEIFSTDSNKLISTNDLSGNYHNTYSMNEDNENNNMNNILNNNSNIINIISHKYYYFNTSLEKDKEELKKNNINLKEYNNKDKHNKHNEVKVLLGKKNKFKKILNFSNEIPNNDKIKIKEKKYFSHDKNKTRNSYHSYKYSNNSLRNYKNKIIKYSNDENYRSCSSYSNKQNYTSTENRKKKKISITKSYMNKPNINSYKYISLSKGKFKKKRRHISEHDFHKDLYSDRLCMSQNINEPKNKNIKNKKSINNQKMKKYFSHDCKNNKNNSKREKNKSLLHKFNTNNKKLNKNHKKFSKEKNNKSNNNIHIIVNRKNKKNKGYNNNEYNEHKQLEFKNNIIKLLHYFLSNNTNMRLANLKIKENKKKLIQTKELFFSLLKQQNRMKEKKSYLSTCHFLVSKNINSKIKLSLVKIKNKELNIFLKMFFSNLKLEIKEFNDSEQILNQKILKLQLSIIKNMIKHYGNISQVFYDDINKKEKLKNILLKNNIIEKESKNNIRDIIFLNKINTNVKKIIKNTFNNDVNYDFNIIKEVQEEKESDRQSNNKNNISSLINDISDEIFFIDKKESFYEEDFNHYKKNKNCQNDYIKNNNYSNSNQDKENNIKSKDKSKKNLRKELIKMNKRKFKGKNLNFDEFDFDYYNENRNNKKDNLFKIGFFNKKE